MRSQGVWHYSWVFMVLIVIVIVVILTVVIVIVVIVTVVIVTVVIDSSNSNSSNGAGAHWSVSQILKEDHQLIAHLLKTMMLVKQPWIYRVC